MKAIAFDLGRVLFDFDYTVALKKIGRKIEVPVEKIIEELFCKDFALDFEKGTVSTRQFYLKFKQEFCCKLGYREFKNAWNAIFVPKKEVIELALFLKQTYPLYLISNINEMHFSYLLKKYPRVFSIFENLILSYKVNSVKPEKKIYAELKKAARRAYNDIIYIDDRRDLITEARRLGLRCIMFENIGKLSRDLKKLGVKL